MNKFNKYCPFYAVFWMFLNTSLLFGQTAGTPDYTLSQVIDLKTVPVSMRNPSAMSVSLYGDIFIVDTDNHLLVKLDGKGNYVTHTGGFGWKDQQLDMPKDVSTFDGLNIYVADYQNQRVQRYNRHLQFISSLGLSPLNRDGMKARSGREIEIGYPVSLSVSPLGDLFCVYQECNSVLKITSTGTLGVSFGGFESGKGKLTKPVRVRATKTKVYILDQSRIVIYDYFGNFLNEIAHTLIRTPNDIAIDRNERIYIAGTNPPGILLFRANGQFIGAMADYEFSNPASLGLYGNQLYALDNQLMRIVAFQLSERR